MRAGTSYEQWRVAEQALKAIEEHIARLGAHETSSLDVLNQLIILHRVHIKAAKRADELWARHRQELEIALSADRLDAV